MTTSLFFVIAVVLSIGEFIHHYKHGKPKIEAASDAFCCLFVQVVLILALCYIFTHCH